MTPQEFHSSRKYADTSYGRIAYVERGSGPAALFVHGLPLCGYAWRGVLEDLAARRRCIALDVMGLGYTEVAEGQHVSFGDQARMIGAFLDVLGIDVVDLVGNDTGAGISQIFAATQPGRVRTLTLTNCEAHDRWPNALLEGFYAGVAAGAIPEAMRAMCTDLKLAREQLGVLVYEDAAVFTAESVALYLSPIVSSPRRIALFQELCDWKTNRAQLMAVADQARRSKIPTQIAWGDADPVFDVAPSLEWLRANLGGLEKVTIVPRGMLFWPEEHPRAASVLVDAFASRAG